VSLIMQNTGNKKMAGGAFTTQTRADISFHGWHVSCDDIYKSKARIRATSRDSLQRPPCFDGVGMTLEELHKLRDFVDFVIEGIDSKTNQK